MNHLSLLKFLNIYEYTKLFKYKIIYSKNKNFSHFNFNNKKNGYFSYVIEFFCIYLEIKIYLNSKKLNNPQVVFNKSITINKNNLMELLCKNINGYVFLSFNKNILILYILILNFILQKIMIMHLNKKFLKFEKTKKNFFFCDLITLLYTEIQVFEKKKYSINIIIIKILKPFFCQFIAKIYNYNTFLFSKPVIIVKFLNYYTYKPIQKFILKNIDFTINLFFIIKYIEKFNRIKFIYIQKKNIYPTFILVRVKTFESGSFSNINKKKVLLCILDVIYET